MCNALYVFNTECIRVIFRENSLQLISFKCCLQMKAVIFSIISRETFEILTLGFKCSEMFIL